MHVVEQILFDNGKEKQQCTASGSTKPSARRYVTGTTLSRVESVLISIHKLHSLSQR